MKKTFMILFAIALSAVVSFGQNKSYYSGLESKDCKTIESDESGTGWYRGSCPGVGGYKLELTEGDLRQSLIVITPSKNEFDLQFSRISPRFSSIGPKAEWRMKGKVPVALIVRYTISVDDEGKTESSLVVIKLSKTDVCITDVIGPAKSQNVLARNAADKAATAPCKEFE